MQDRDVIAMHLLAGILAAQAQPQSSGAIPVDPETAEWTARYAYVYADALLRAAEAQPEEGR